MGIITPGNVCYQSKYKIAVTCQTPVYQIPNNSLKTEALFHSIRKSSGEVIIDNLSLIIWAWFIINSHAALLGPYRG